ncbi:MAG: hypothetical protein C5B54_08180, partial [Acidobacteria bacterium]
YIEALWSVTPQEEVPAYPVLPDGCVDIIFSPSTGLQIVGTMTKPQTFRLVPDAQIMGMRFRPGIASNVFRVSMQEFVDRTIQLAEIWPAMSRQLMEQLCDQESLQKRLSVFSQSIQIDFSPTPIQKAINNIVQSAGQVSLETVACEANLSLRQFRRLCGIATGLSPKTLCRILRFRNAQSQLSSKSSADLAVACGYYDQSHLIDDFREFSGTTPAKFVLLQQR